MQDALFISVEKKNKQTKKKKRKEKKVMKNKPVILKYRAIFDVT